MAGVCDICGGKIGFRNTFRCQDGVICKNCYRIVSNNFSSTITKSTLLDLKKNYIRNAQPLDIGADGFQTTKKLGSFLLLDEKNHKFCLLSNRNLTKKYSRPEIYRYEELEAVALVSQPDFTEQKLEALTRERHGKTVVEKLTVRIHLKNGQVRDIVVIPTPVRAGGFAFRQSYRAANEILQVFQQIHT